MNREVQNEIKLIKMKPMKREIKCETSTTTSISKLIRTSLPLIGLLDRGLLGYGRLNNDLNTILKKIIPGTKLGTCQVSAHKVDPWSRYRRDIRTDGRTDGQE